MLQAGRWPESDVSHKVPDIGARLSDIARLHRSKLFNCRAAEFNLKQFDDARNFHGSIIAYVIDFPGRSAGRRISLVFRFVVWQRGRWRSRTSASVTSSIYVKSRRILPLLNSRIARRCTIAESLANWPHRKRADRPTNGGRRPVRPDAQRTETGSMRTSWSFSNDRRYRIAGGESAGT